MSAPRTRREFVRALAVAPALAPAVLAADEPPNEGQSEVDARMAGIVARFGEHLDADARKAIRVEVVEQVLRAEAIRAIPLDNGEGPLPVFTPYRRPE